MTARPIIFDAESINAILSGRKWQTRRVMKPQPATIDDFGGWYRMPSGGMSLNCYLCPYGEVGGLLWVRETWACDEYGRRHQSRGMVYYRADAESMGAWRPSIFMPRWASRLTLRLTDVRIERLQDITVDDIRAEGLAPDNEASLLWRENIRAKWRLRWDSINGKRAPWVDNPFVWVLSFERVEE